jgi:hypothetical protein
VKYLILTEYDDANGGYLIYQSLKAVGADVGGMKMHRHKFNYPDQLCLAGYAEMAEAVRDANVIIFSQICKDIMDLVKHQIKTKKVVVVHGGSEYRKNKPMWNTYCNEFATHTILSADNWDPNALPVNPFMWMVIDTDTLRPKRWYEGGRVKIYHSPSSAKFKGTSEIIEAVKKIEGLYPGKTESKILTEPIPYAQHIENVHWCDVYIDQMCLKKDGQITGGWGTAAREAAAMGKVVISSDLHDELYRSQFPEVGLPTVYAANSEEQIVNVLRSFILIRPDRLKLLQELSSAWMHNTHGLKAAGERLIERISTEKHNESNL